MGSNEKSATWAINPLKCWKCKGFSLSIGVHTGHCSICRKSSSAHQLIWSESAWNTPGSARTWDIFLQTGTSIKYELGTTTAWVLIFSSEKRRRVKYNYKHFGLKSSIHFLVIKNRHSRYFMRYLYELQDSPHDALEKWYAFCVLVLKITTKTADILHSHTDRLR